MKNEWNRWLEISLPGLFIAMALTACIPDPLEVSGIPKVKPQIVVSTQIVPDQALVVLLTKTFGALEASDDSDPEQLLRQIAVTDAVVVLAGPDGRDTLQALGNGVYGHIVLPLKEGEEYSLYVKSETMGEVSATTKVKPRITFDDIKAQLYFAGFDDTLAQITYRFTDPPEKNWYMLNVQHVEQERLAENILNPRVFTRVMADNDFNGGQYHETFRVFPRDFKPGDTIAVFLSNISEEYYRFVKLRLDNRFSFVEFLGEPINYPSNVEGGKGFFNLYVPDIRILELEE
jgi:hypothetical protein